MKFYHESVGECVNQVYEINALAERLFDGSLEKLRKVVEEIM